MGQVYREQVDGLYRFLRSGFSFLSGARRMRAGRLGVQGLDLDDVVQETFRRAFSDRARAAYDGVRPYRNYLFMIARNVVLTELSRGRRLIPMGAAFTPGVEAEELSAGQREAAARLSEETADVLERSLEDRELARLVSGFVGALGEEEAQVFVSRFIDRRPQDQLAEALGCTRSRVRAVEGMLRRSFSEYTENSGYFEHRRPRGAAPARRRACACSACA